MLYFVFCRGYIESGWCMEEFTIAHQKVVEGNKNFIIVVLVEDLDIDTLPNELQSYLRTYTYIDARNYENDLENIRKKIRYSMPGTPLEKIREKQRERESAAERGDGKDTGIEVNDEHDDEEAPEIDEFNTVDETNQEATTSTSGSSSDDILLLPDFLDMQVEHDEIRLEEKELLMARIDGLILEMQELKVKCKESLKANDQARWIITNKRTVNTTRPPPDTPKILPTPNKQKQVPAKKQRCAIEVESEDKGSTLCT